MEPVQRRVLGSTLGSTWLPEASTESVEGLGLLSEFWLCYDPEPQTLTLSPKP